MWERATSCAAQALPGMGLAAGDRPTADVDVLAGAFAVVEYELARRMHAATIAGSLPSGRARGGARRPRVGRPARPPARPHRGAWRPNTRRMAAAWAAGIITSEHVDAVARNTGPLTDEELVGSDRRAGHPVGVSGPRPRSPGWSPPRAACCTHPPMTTRGRGRRPHHQGPVLRTARGHRDPVRNPAPTRGRGRDRCDRRPGRTACAPPRTTFPPGPDAPMPWSNWSTRPRRMVPSRPAVGCPSP